jgi:hypothetical protein
VPKNDHEHCFLFVDKFFMRLEVSKSESVLVPVLSW